MAPLEPLIDKTVVENSSNVHSRGYDAARLVLAVMFKNGTMYHHHGVPASVFNDWLLAPSAGTFYSQNIRGKYASIKMSGHCPNCGAQGIVGLICVDCGTADCLPDKRPIVEPAGLRKARDRDIDLAVDRIADRFDAPDAGE